jgi:hypothetical protein
MRGRARDQQGLLAGLHGFQSLSRKMVVDEESTAAFAFAHAIERELGWATEMPAGALLACEQHGHARTV